jgi:hypothetical protein
MEALIIAVAAFGLNAVGGIIGLVWAVAKIKSELTTQITEEREETMGQFAAIRTEFLNEQKVQDHNFGEVGAAMRQYIADVEKKVREVEIWGRDNYAMKDDVRDILKDIKDMRADIKTDFRDLNIKIDQKP